MYINLLYRVNKHAVQVLINQKTALSMTYSPSRAWAQLDQKLNVMTGYSNCFKSQKVRKTVKLLRQ